MDREHYQKYIVTGCVQSGKTLNAVLIPLCWHLFERTETVVYGLPSMDMASDKWNEEIKPVIEASPTLRQWLPSGGQGSRGGTPSAIKFRNGVTMKFMSAQGSDAKRSAFTAPVVVKTEVDRYDTAGLASRETDPASQMDGRTEAFAEFATIYEECTITTASGRINNLYYKGTQHELYSPCVHCGEWVCPTRENFIGFEDCQTSIAAAREGQFSCPSCGECYSEDDRYKMIDAMEPLAVGEKMIDGAKTGKPIETAICSYKWHAWHNRFWSQSHIAGGEWEASHANDWESKERGRRQFVWTLPAEPEEFDVIPLTVDDVLGKARYLRRGECQEGAKIVAVGADLGKRKIHYVAGSFTENGSGHIPEINTIGCDSDKLGTFKGILDGLRTLREVCETGWSGIKPSWVWIDAGYMPDVVRYFQRENRKMGLNRYIAVYGRGRSQYGKGPGNYIHPTKTTSEIKHLGEQYHVRWYQKHGAHAILVNSDYWKTRFRESIAAEPEVPGAITIFEPIPEDEHKLVKQYARHITSEDEVIQIKEDKGPVPVWINKSRSPNHFNDASYYMVGAAHLSGVRVVKEVKSPRLPERIYGPQLTRSDHRPFNLHSRRK